VTTKDEENKKDKERAGHCMMIEEGMLDLEKVGNTKRRPDKRLDRQGR